MAKWKGNLSTTEPYNYIGILKVRYGNVNHETCQFTIVENGQPVNLLDFEVYFQAILAGYPVEEKAKIVDAKNGIIEFTFTNHSMQSLGKQTAYFQFRRGEQVIGTTQDFNYFVINAVGNTTIDTGAYWQTVQELIDDMSDFINHNEGDFTQWFESVKEILYGLDPGGKLLQELIEARYSIDKQLHTSLKERLIYDFEKIYQKIENDYTLFSHEIDSLIILQDDKFSKNHETLVADELNIAPSVGALVIAEVDNIKQNRFKLVEVGELNA